MLRENRQRLREAEPHFQDALQYQERARQLFSNDQAELRDCLLELARSHYNLGIVRMDTGRPDQAREDYKQAVDILTELHLAQPAEPSCRHDLARALINRGILHKENSQPWEATKDYQAALEHLRWLHSRFDKRVLYKYDLAVLLQNQGNLLEGQKQLDAARLAQQESYRLLKELVADFSTRPRYKKKLANTLNSQGIGLYLVGDQPGAEQCWNQACDLLKPLLQQVNNPTDYHAILGIALGNLGWLRLEKEMYMEARSLLEPAIQHLKAGLPPGVVRRDYLDALRRNTQSLAESLVQLGDHAAAVTVAHDLANIFPDEPLGSYYAACFVARSIEPALRDEKLGAEANRQARKRQYADQAVALLRTTLLRGVENMQRLPKDKEADIFRYLQGQADFEEVKQELDKRTTKR